MTRNTIDSLECIQFISLHDTVSAISAFRNVFGFELDEKRADGPPELSIAVLRHGNCELRICYVADTVNSTKVVFICDSVESWRKQLILAGYQPVVCQDVGEPITLECQITNELQLVIEAKDNNSSDDDVTISH